MNESNLSKEAQEKLPILRALFGDEGTLWSEAIVALWWQLREGADSGRLDEAIQQVDPGYWERIDE